MGTMPDGDECFLPPSLEASIARSQTASAPVPKVAAGYAQSGNQQVLPPTSGSSGAAQYPHVLPDGAHEHHAHGPHGCCHGDHGEDEEDAHYKEVCCSVLGAFFCLEGRFTMFHRQVLSHEPSACS